MVMKNYTQKRQKHVWCHSQFYIVENIQTTTIRHAGCVCVCTFFIRFSFLFILTFNASK